jgi:hypothetical protein
MIDILHCVVIAVFSVIWLINMIAIAAVARRKGLNFCMESLHDILENCFLGVTLPPPPPPLLVLSGKKHYGRAVQQLNCLCVCLGCPARRLCLLYRPPRYFYLFGSS